MHTRAKMTDNLEVKTLEFYSDSLPLYNNGKKFRCLFESSQIRDLYSVLYFNNKCFSASDWNLTVEFRVSLANSTVVTNQLTSVVSLTDSTGKIECRLNHSSGSHGFLPGIYTVECLVEGEIITQREFCIVNSGLPNQFGSPYIFSRGSELYFENPETGEIEYKNVFVRDTTSKICLKFKATNLLVKTKAWLFEVLIRIRTQTGELVVCSNALHKFNLDDSYIESQLCWGKKGEHFWSAGSYRLEVYFLEKSLLDIPFFVVETLNDAEKIQLSVSQDQSAHVSPQSRYIRSGNQSLLDELMALPGHDQVKESIVKKYHYLKFLSLRKENGINDVDERINIHSVFTGNAGSGKSVFARILGKLYKDASILSKGGVIELSRNDLLGDLRGSTAPKVEQLIKNNMGNVIMINNANTLYSDYSTDYGMEALETINKHIAHNTANVCIVLAGETGPMNKFISNNQNISSKFSSVYHFSDYTPEDLFRIAHNVAEKQQVILDPDSQELLKTEFQKAYRSRGKNFGNSRYALSVVCEAKQNLGNRIINETINSTPPEIVDLKTIRRIDLEPVFNKRQEKVHKPFIDRDELNSLLNELNSLVGLDNIKSEVNELVKLAEYYTEIGKDFTSAISLHTIFKGNPGTGKTTLARILSGIYRALGLLEKGHLIETNREGLIAKYVGQTAEKTATKIEEAMGGVLFIDEAYSLFSENSESDYGPEAISTLMQYMENKRGEFAVIIAGYSTEIEMLLDSNPGFRSRFDSMFEFEDYDLDELIRIGVDCLLAHDLKFDENALLKFKQIVEKMCIEKHENFGNARDIRNLIERISRNQNLRIGASPKNTRTKKVMQTVIEEDIKRLGSTSSRKTKKLGF